MEILLPWSRWSKPNSKKSTVKLLQRVSERFKNPVTLVIMTTLRCYSAGTEITCIQFSPIGDDLVIGMSNGNMMVLDGKSNKCSVKHNLNFHIQVCIISQTPYTFRSLF